MDHGVRGRSHPGRVAASRPLEYGVWQLGVSTAVAMRTVPSLQRDQPAESAEPRDIVMNGMTETTPLVLSIIGTGLTATALLVTVIVFAWTNMGKRLDGLKGDMNSLKGDMNSLKDDMNRQFDEVNHRLERVETRIDDTNKRIDAIGRDIADLRDRTGTLEGTLSTFMNEGRSPNAA